MTKYPRIPLKSSLCLTDDNGNSLFRYDTRKYLGTLEKVNAENISSLIVILERAHFDIIRMKRFGKKIIFTVQTRVSSDK